MPVVSLPAVPGTQPRAWGCYSGPHCRKFRMESTGPPRFPENPPVPMPCSSTPAGPRAPGHTASRHGPRSDNGEGYPQQWFFRGSIARPRHSLSTLRGLVSPHRDARLASGCWPNSAGRDSLPAGFPRKVSEVIVTSLPPLLSFPGAMSGTFTDIYTRKKVPDTRSSSTTTGTVAGSVGQFI